MIGYVTWSDDEKRYLLKNIDGQLVIKSKNLGYIERVVRSGWDQATKFGITEIQVQGDDLVVKKATEVQPQKDVENFGVFNSNVNVRAVVGQISFQPEGKRGRGRPRRYQAAPGVRVHREFDTPSKYVEVTARQRDQLKREYRSLTGTVTQRVLSLADRHGMAYRQVQEIVV
jgi:hypothetical protein